VAPIRVELLGKLRFACGQHLLTSVSTKRLQSLLAFLVLHSDVAQSREYLAFLLWPESSESQARTNLRQLIHNLRRALPVECSLLITDNRTVRWRLDNSCSIDVSEFEAAVSRAAGAEKKGDFTAAREALEEAARLYQDDLLPDLYDEWLQTKRDQLRQQHAEVLSHLAALLEMSGDYPAAIRHATRLITVDPLREPSYQLLMQLHVRNHDRSSALRVYHQCMRTLKRELGISPTQATLDLFARALKADQMPAAPTELPPYAATVPLPMVGRASEWEGLLACWRRVTQGQTRFALILGEPGVGKSRLAEELFRYCSQYPDGAAARARCYFAHGRLAYGPAAEWLRAESLQLARAQLPRPQLAELARVLPEILIENQEIGPPQPLIESWQRRHLHEALNAAFAKGPKPLLLFIDDLQWCDHDSFEWLHSFFRSGAAGRTLVLGTVRPEEAGRDHPLAGFVSELRRSGQLSEFLLSPLSMEEAAALAIQVAGRECDPAFLNGIYQATKGNPLFVVESVRALLENQGESQNGHQADDQAAKRLTPPRVQAVIEARLAQLSSPAYELAGLTATIGRPFSFDLLAKATDWDEDSLSRALEELWQRRIIDGQGSDSYDYTHDLLREVAYSGLSPIRRRSLHQRVARALEELHASDLDAVAGWLAAHYEAGGKPEQAIPCYRTAASVAKQRFADVEAADLIRGALRLCRDFPETAKRDKQELGLLVTLGPSLVTTLGYSMPEVGETYERGLLLSRRSGGEHLFSVLSGAWLFRIVRGDLEESRQLAEYCVHAARRERAAAAEMAARFLLGISLFHLGQITASREQMDQAAQADSAPSDPALALFAGPDVGVFSRAYLSHLLWHLGQADQAAADSEESIALAGEISHPFSLAIALDYAAMFNVFRQESQLALARAREASAVCRKHGFAYYQAWAEILEGWATAAEGDPLAGLTHLRHGLDALKATGAEVRLPFYYGLLAEVCGMAGHIGEALANVATGFAFQSKNGELWSAPELHRIHGDVLMLSGDASQSQVSYQRAIESARQIGATSLELRAADRMREPLKLRSSAHKASER
jgi:DNA-binding SARP family transcriptional activator